MDGFNIFISWSGERSRGVGHALREWLPKVIQIAKPWMSANDIEKGEPWSAAIAKQLESLSFGIVCFTPDNLAAPWLHFEAGSLAKMVTDRARVCPYLLGLGHTDLLGPLSQFQAALANKKETRDLVVAINRALDHPLTEARLSESFDMWWPDLEKSLKQIAEAAPLEPSPERTERDLLEEVLERLRALQREAQTPPTPETFDKVFTSTLIRKLIDRMQSEMASASTGPEQAQTVLDAVSKDPTLMARLVAELPNIQLAEEAEEEGPKKKK